MTSAAVKATREAESCRAGLSAYPPVTEQRFILRFIMLHYQMLSHALLVCTALN